MGTTTRTIIHHSLRVIGEKNKVLDPKIIISTMEFVKGLPKPDRRLDDPSVRKMHFLEKIVEDNGIYVGNFKSAKYDYRPPLIEKNTLNERKNPKLQTEGETELTHFGLAEDGDDILLFLELKRNGIAISTFVRYLKTFLHNIKNKCSIEYGLSVKGDFDAKLKEMSRATAVEIFVPTKVVTDTFGDDPITTKNVKHEAMISLKAEKTTSIKQSARDIFDLMRNHKADITRIKIYGRIGDVANTVLDSNKLKDKSTLTVATDDNNQVLTDDMLSKMKGALRDVL